MFVLRYGDVTVRLIPGLDTGLPATSSTGEVLAVSVTGRANVVAFDADRAERKLTKYLGADRDRWPDRFTGVFDDPSSRLVVLRPSVAPRLRDLSFSRPT
jgi:hypothetical protein